ncbi:hypothetical protein [Mucilaginibacter lappiensis]|uniref:Uncharacterized protein n=1 Tax=Mucilaginibacter lappiensis TaxID=354630 RepID=A0A841JSP1_9SPHI|nr:hypothetical protein [Mucilaginibacter lappiensis]MBB6131798.1 hypothetical protein [Mucilaginibacter lappiensis]
MKKTFLLITCVLSIQSVSFAQKGDYKTMLNKVESHGKVTGDSTTIKVDSLTNPNNFHYTYTDKNIDFTIYRGVTEFYFDLKNNSGQTLKILWDDAAYINTDGTTNKVIHTGVKFIDRNNSQPATSIINGAKISDIVAPTNNVYYSSGSYGGWEQLPLLPKPKRHTDPQYNNTQIKILLPISIDGASIEYIFTMNVKWAEEIKKKKS